MVQKLILKLITSPNVIFVIAFFLLFDVGIALAQNNFDSSNNQTIKLFLPIESKPFSSMIKSLENDLLKNNINNIEVESIDHWHAYQQGLRVGRVGFYFAPPHFTAWALSEHGFKAMLRVSDPLRYVIAAKRTNSDIFEINDLINRRICSEKAYSLSYLASGSVISKQIGSANIGIVESVEKQMTKATTNCDAFSISDHLFKKLSLRSPTRYIRLHQSIKTNNYALIAHPDIADKRIAALTKYFLKSESQELITPLLSIFSKSGSLILSKSTDYPSDYYKNLIPYWKK